MGRPISKPVSPSTATSEGDRDGLSNAAVEAMARGVPVVTTTAGSAAEVIRDGEEGLLVPPDDPAALAAALERLAREPELHARVGAAGCARARAELDLELTARRLADVLIEGIEESAAERAAGKAAP